MGFKWERLAQVWMQKFHGLLGFEGSALVHIVFERADVGMVEGFSRERRGVRGWESNFLRPEDFLVFLKSRQIQQIQFASEI
jgi:hypothetical protein